MSTQMPCRGGKKNNNNPEPWSKARSIIIKRKKYIQIIFFLHRFFLFVCFTPSTLDTPHEVIRNYGYTLCTKLAQYNMP